MHNLPSCNFGKNTNQCRIKRALNLSFLLIWSQKTLFFGANYYFSITNPCSSSFSLIKLHVRLKATCKSKQLLSRRLSSAVEQLSCKQQVVGPNPTDGSRGLKQEAGLAE